MRLIDADALYERIKEHHDLFVDAWGGFKNLPENDKARVDAYTSCIAELLNAPTIDVAPVVPAHWIKTFGSDGFVSTLRCSKCGNAENSTYIPGNFCWFCGARMDGKAK